MGQRETEGDAVGSGLEKGLVVFFSGNFRRLFALGSGYHNKSLIVSYPLPTQEFLKVGLLELHR